ncbi:hypothetical protein SESBI_28137 [Sesbania bispinosa]|nr:hypothetical protein SESBI_28137 [Sesbania bispinosa]
MPPSFAAFVRRPEPACGLRRASMSLPFAPLSRNSRSLRHTTPSPLLQHRAPPCLPWSPTLVAITPWPPPFLFSSFYNL